MNVKFLAACAAAWLVLPLAASAASDSATVGLAKAGGDLLTPEDYIEYASINDVNIHELYFSAILYEGTESCLMCHQETAESMLGMGHFRWQGKVENIVGQKGQDVGKNQLLNNFCIAVPTNEPRCTQCHTGYGYADKNYNFNDPANIDCLVCHDQSGTYAKAPKTAGLPEPGVDLNAVARSIALGGNPTIDNCIDCHAKAGGGDNVKHGDIAMNLANTTREYDVHMGVDGADLDCVDCHGANGGGDGPRAYFIFPKPRNFHDPDTREYLSRRNLYNGIKFGVVGKEMPAWGKVLSDSQVADLTEYVYRQFIATDSAE